MYRIVTADEAFKIRTNWVQTVINQSLLLKRDNILRQMQIVDGRVEEVKNVKNSIERDAKQE